MFLEHVLVPTCNLKVRAGRAVFTSFGHEKDETMVKGDGLVRFRCGLVCKAHRMCVSLNARLEGNKEEKRQVWFLHRQQLGMVSFFFFVY